MGDAKIIHEKGFCIPVHTLKVTYHPVLKKPMDILMKMLLKAFSTGVFKDGETIADVLLVEPLFVNDLLVTMEKSALIHFDEVYTLTAKGKQQLADGVYEEQLDVMTDLLQYSPLHERFLAGDIEDVLEFDEFPEEVLDSQATIQVSEQVIIDVLNEVQDDEEELQTFVTEVVEHEDIQINDVPCLAFICHDVGQDRLFARVYNTLSNEWDPVLEDVLHQLERAQWRELYL